MSSEKDSSSLNLSGQPLCCTTKEFSMTMFKSMHSLIDEVVCLKFTVDFYCTIDPDNFRTDIKSYCDIAADLSFVGGTLRDTAHVAKLADTEQHLEYPRGMCLVLFILKHYLQNPNHSMLINKEFHKDTTVFCSKYYFGTAY